MVASSTHVGITCSGLAPLLVVSNLNMNNYTTQASKK